MGQTTKIAFCDSTVNPTAGCDGCELWRWDPSADEGRGSCFAAAIHNQYVPTVAGRPSPYPRPFHFVETRPGRMAAAAAWSDLRGSGRPKKPWLDGLPRVTFIGDMADNFSQAINLSYLHREVLSAVQSEAGRRHAWLWFTKRPGRMRLFASHVAGRHQATWPPNLMAVTSATDQRTLEQRLPHLMAIPTRWKGLSLEPMRGPIDLAAVGPNWWQWIGWVIAGGESRDRTRPLDPDWIRRVRDECLGRGVPFFFKQWGVGRPGRELDGRMHEEVPQFTAVA